MAETSVLILIGLFTILLLNFGAVVNNSLNGISFKYPGQLTESITVAGTHLSPGNQATEADAVPNTDNKPPRANAGLDRVVHTGKEITLDGTDSMDEDGTIEEYSWILEDTDDNCDPVTETLQNGKLAKTKFMAPKEISQQECTYYYQLEVKDNNGSIDSDDVIVKVQRADTGTVNKMPIAYAGKDRRIQEGESITLDGTGSFDEDGKIVSYKWNIEEWDDEDPSGKLSNLNSATTRFTAPELNDPPGVYGIDLTVEDNDGKIDVDTIIIHVTAKSSKMISSQDSGTSNTDDDGERALSDKNESNLPLYVGKVFQLSPFTLSCHYSNQTSELIFCDIICCSQSGNFTTFRSNETSGSEGVLLKRLLNQSVIFFNNTNVVGKIVPLNETESSINLSATSLFNPPLSRNYTIKDNNLSNSSLLS